ncbi:MAG: hypothetical protein IJ759_07920 [Bacteroidales bacterium]|nr:hypothetical protein [Bacteroidales bacterium]MBR1775431.1 hypothetical protein [Bacteroidales bacterium]
MNTRNNNAVRGYYARKRQKEVKDEFATAILQLRCIQTLEDCGQRQKRVLTKQPTIYDDLRIAYCEGLKRRIR